VASFYKAMALLHHHGLLLPLEQASRALPKRLTTHWWLATKATWLLPRAVHLLLLLLRQQR
jgi:hypothetical protein